MSAAPRSLRTLALVAANLAIAALIAVPLLGGDSGAGRAAAPQHGANAPPPLAPLGPFVAYAATIERPLFSPTRRPASLAAAPGAAAIEGRYRLQGLVIAGTARHALVTEIAGGRTRELGEGDALEGWTVTRIEQDRVMLTSPAGEAMLALPSAASPDPAKR